MKDETAMNPVRYYVGDLCYVMHPEWDEVCDTVSFDNEQSAYTLADGRQFFMLNTAYGDGSYNDPAGREYFVDSGTLGAIKVEDITDPAFKENVERGLGQIVEMPGELTEDDCYADRGTLVFGTVIIETAGEEEEEDYEDEDEDEDA